MKLKPTYLFAILATAVVGLWLLYPQIIHSDLARSFMPASGWANRGLVGDSFGALNTLFSGLALTGLVVTIYIQSSQLKLLEDKESGNELLLELQAKTLRQTALLNYYNDELSRMERYLKDYREAESAGYASASIEAKIKERHKDFRSKRDMIVDELSLTT